MCCHQYSAQQSDESIIPISIKKGKASSDYKAFLLALLGEV